MKIMLFILAAAMATVSCVPGDTGAGNSSVAGNTAVQPAAVKPSPRSIDYPALKTLLEAPGSTVLLLDVRTREEYDTGYIPGAILAPYDTLQSTFSEPDKNRPIVVYCRSGRRSAIAVETLVRMGYTDIADFGAIDRWKGALQR